ncbi:hypothetical protein JFY71_11385 [Miniphocaeibacter halophilus]|uniref:Uncharacterized protein n=2 Tax=Miniphocaeibacter halophilus TaxID=2931922 RepID=A0AC61NI53_9FIRM|nr:hypothetical protein JFY71_11385 [Miniphocaeibacter halophilus]
MIGLKIGEKELVSRAWREDGIFFIIYLLSFLFFILNTIKGIKVLITVLSIWFITQFLSHELYTIVGGGEGKIRFFSNTIKVFESSSKYIPDLYHIILHTLILFALITTVIYFYNLKKIN